jgi:hypothetical protein
MDPFSIIVGSASLIDMTLRVTKFLKEIHLAAKNVGEDAKFLSAEIQALDTVNKSVLNLYEIEVAALPDENTDIPDGTRTLWENTGLVLRNCQEAVQKLELVLEKIVGKDGPIVTRRRESIKQHLRKESKNNELSDIRFQLAAHRESLHLSLTILDLCVFHLTML